MARDSIPQSPSQRSPLRLDKPPCMSNAKSCPCLAPSSPKPRSWPSATFTGAPICWTRCSMRRRRRRSPRRVRRLVLTGDLVDRGRDSLGALKLAREAGDRIGARETIALMGNHEILMRMALDPAVSAKIGQTALRVWLRNGGGAVVEQILGDDLPRRDARLGIEALREATPEWVVAWLEGPEAALSLRRRAVRPCGGAIRSCRWSRFSRQPWDEPLERLDEQGALGLGARALSRLSAGRARLFRLFRRPRPYAARPRLDAEPHRAGLALPAQSRRRLRDDGHRENGDLSRRSRRGRHGGGRRSGP